MPAGIYKHKPHSKETIEKIRLSNLGRKISAETRLKISRANKGRKMPPRSEEYKRNITLRATGKPHPHKGWVQSQETKDKIRKSLIGKKNPKNSGKNHYAWKGGNSKSNIIRRSGEYKKWRNEVYVRDNYTCQKYGTIGGRIEPHHINNFADFPELRFDINNGVTLSVKAHKEFHKIYGKRNNTREQFEEFISSTVIK